MLEPVAIEHAKEDFDVIEKVLAQHLIHDKKEVELQALKIQAK